MFSLESERREKALPSPMWPGCSWSVTFYWYVIISLHYFHISLFNKGKIVSPTKNFPSKGKIQCGGTAGKIQCEGTLLFPLIREKWPIKYIVGDTIFPL